MFYTYAHYKPNDDVFYIGKGIKNRAWSERRNPHWKNVVAKNNGYKVEILAKWPTEQEALDHERFLIECFRQMGARLANISDGGKGQAGVKMSQDTRRKMSEAHKNKSKSIEHRQSFSESMKKRPKEYWDKVKAALNSEKVKAKVSKSRSGSNNGNFLGAITATSVLTGAAIVCVGTKQLKAAGFIPSCVYQALQGRTKTHKGHVFTRINFLEKT